MGPTHPRYHRQTGRWRSRLQLYPRYRQPKLWRQGPRVASKLQWLSANQAHSVPRRQQGLPVRSRGWHAPSLSASISSIKSQLQPHPRPVFPQQPRKYASLAPPSQPPGAVGRFSDHSPSKTYTYADPNAPTSLEMLLSLLPHALKLKKVSTSSMPEAKTIVFPRIRRSGPCA
jgi:hypothetical protein